MRPERIEYFLTQDSKDEMSRHIKLSYKFLCNQNLGIQVQEETHLKKNKQKHKVALVVGY